MFISHAKVDGFVKSPDAALRQAQGRLSAVRGEL